MSDSFSVAPKCIPSGPCPLDFPDDHWLDANDPKHEEFLIAANKGDIPKMEKLLSQGVNVNVSFTSAVKVGFPNENPTSLVAAVCGGRPWSVKFLLDNWAFPKATDASGMTALHYLVWVTRDKLTDKMISNCLETLGYLLDYGADVNAKDNQGITPLMMAVYYEFTEMVDALLKVEGIDKLAVDKDGNNALRYAFGARNSDIIKMLIKTGAYEEEQVKPIFPDPNIRTKIDDMHIYLNGRYYPDSEQRKAESKGFA